MTTFNSIRGIFFSPTGSTREITEFATRQLASRWNLPYSLTSYTLPAERDQWVPLRSDELVVWGTPVYAGRIPNKTLDFVKEHLQCPGAKFVAIAVYGGRNYDDTLAELCQIATDGGLTPIGATAVEARHTFSPTLNAGHPNTEDYEALAQFCQRIDLNRTSPIIAPGNPRPEKYYTPLKQDMQPAKFLKSKPSVDVNLCTRCGQCAEHCTMGSIRMEDGLPQFEGVCIKCQACVFHCPAHAIGIRDEQFLSHIQMLEENIKACRPCEFYG